ncbi:MAG: RecX family transcriptional regulator [Flavobacteriales bacterium]|nr:RecX family transcriptional regulator [Flavobacteriales bacterium]MCB9190962.1 RecX family transcriptional regulator [Flavobacteriales bacterium]MCB9204803.1 RecX family transcriptional regulator [Flavobacteriales bacterium]
MEEGPKALLEKLRKYCAYQERSHHDVVQKMWDLNIPQEWRDEMLLALIQENFLNEERFARTYVRGKFNIKKWGRIKIIQGLKQHDVSKRCIQLALTEIDEDSYLQALQEAIELKRSKLKEKNPWKRRGAIYRFVTGRGFEGNLVTEAIKDL